MPWQVLYWFVAIGGPLVAFGILFSDSQLAFPGTVGVLILTVVLLRKVKNESKTWTNPDLVGAAKKILKVNVPKGLQKEDYPEEGDAIE